MLKPLGKLWIFKGTILALALVLSGCATAGRSRTEVSDTGWWYASFFMNWPQDDEPLWQIDPLLAHKVVAPVLERYGKEIPLWRFHRRAARDQTGHRFSFIFYGSSGTARRIYGALRADPTLR
ncbi:MAG: hypothetical protein ACLGPL_05900, partial [Acidobacteriota bacterium]